MNCDDPNHSHVNGVCEGPTTCPLNNVKAGSLVRIKQLNGSQEVTLKLREMGFCEEQRIKLLLKHTNTSIVCQVCNSRIGLSAKLAESIMVESIGTKHNQNPPR